MKRFYIAFAAQQGGRDWAGVIIVTGSDNIMNISRRVDGMQWANICTTRKAAEDMAANWNEAFKRNGTSIYTEGIA